MNAQWSRTEGAFLISLIFATTAQCKLDYLVIATSSFVISSSRGNFPDRLGTPYQQGKTCSACKENCKVLWKTIPMLLICCISFPSRLLGIHLLPWKKPKNVDAKKDLVIHWWVLNAAAAVVIRKCASTLVQWRIYGAIAKIWFKNGRFGCAISETTLRAEVASKTAKQHVRAMAKSKIDKSL